MLINKEPTIDWLTENQSDWDIACELVESEQYDQVAEYLCKVQVVRKQRDNALLADIIAAAYQICLACKHSRSETVWHREAYEEAGRREHELKQLLYDLLNLVSRGAMLEAPEQSGLPLIEPMVGLNGAERNSSQSVEQSSLWQRIQNLLGLGAMPRSPKCEVSTRSVTESAVLFAETPRTPVTLSPEKTEGPAAPFVEPEKGNGQDLHWLVVYCLGPFQVYQGDQPVEEWSNRKSKSLFKYLVTHHERPVAKEVLMDLFWPNANPDAARNNLNVAIYNIRQVFRVIWPDFSPIVFQDDYYLLNPDMTMWLDFEKFIQSYQAGLEFERQGKFAEAIREYQLADGLYQGDFLEDDLYEDWPILQRENLKDSYLIILDRLSRSYFKEEKYATCIHLCQKILAKDNCREDAHRRLMRCYSRQGQSNLALRQYHFCVATLAEVLDVPPADETVTLYRRIRSREQI